MKSLSTSRRNVPHDSFVVRPARADVKLAMQEHVDLMMGGLHAMEHAAIGVLPLFALCDRNDIGGVSTNLHPDTGKAQVFIYDGHPGGVGIAEHGYGRDRGTAVGNARRGVEMPVRRRRRLPIVHTIAEVREQQRLSKQGCRVKVTARDTRGIGMWGGGPQSTAAALISSNESCQKPNAGVSLNPCYNGRTIPSPIRQYTLGQPEVA